MINVFAPDGHDEQVDASGNGDELECLAIGILENPRGGQQDESVYLPNGGR